MAKERTRAGRSPFVYKGKYAGSIILIPAQGVSKDKVLELGALTVSKPIEGLKDPK